jgi:dolichyl-phosphate beta-glucosyltransferase
VSGTSRAIGLVVPVFDEAERLDEFVTPLVEFVAGQPTGSQLLFVDDGSTDGSADKIGALLGSGDGRARLLRRPHLGKGAAVAAGLRALDTPLRAFCDLDLATPLPDLERVIECGARPGVLAIGSRDLAASRVVQAESRIRELLGRTYNRLLQAALTPGIVDTQCGAKAASAEVWSRLLAHSIEPGFAWDAEVVALASVLGVEVQEVPIEWRHDPRSRVRVVRDGARMVAATPGIWQRRRALARAAALEPSGSEVFDATNAERLLGTDRTHWWFRSKAAFVATALRRTAPSGGNRGHLVDAGAGGGGVTAMVGWSAGEVTVVEGSAVLVGEAVRRHGFTGVQASVDALPLAPSSVSVVCLLDVIEHLEDPVTTLGQARAALAPGGRVVVNVPAHAWLWSTADVELGHHRRYTRRLLREHLAAAGLRPVLMSHVFSWLVPPVWVTRRLARPGEAALGLDQTSPLIDRASMLLTWSERQLLGRVGLPLGTSVLAVAVADGR